MKAFLIPILVSILSLSACTPAYIQAQKIPKDVIVQAKARLGEHNIAVDPTGQNPRQIRSILYCFRDADRQGFQWSRAFGVPAPSPVGFTHTGSQAEHDIKRKTCDRIFRIGVEAQPEKSGSRIRVSSEWWKLHIGRCIPDGNPLLGKMTCTYSYRGTRAPRDVRGHLYGILKGL